MQSLFLINNIKYTEIMVKIGSLRNIRVPSKMIEKFDLFEGEEIPFCKEYSYR